MGIFPEYIDVSGARRVTSDHTRELILAAMGVDASSEAGARAALAMRDEEQTERLVEPVRVVRTLTGKHRLTLPFCNPLPGSWDCAVEVLTESGDRWEWSEGLRGGRRRVPRMPMRQALGYGYHDLTVTLRGNGRELVGRQLLVVAPRTCYTVGECLGSRRLYGLNTNLYTVRSGTNWGVGDLRDLETIVAWAAQIGAAFVGTNPLHALRNRGQDTSPYSPVSRLYRNPLYLDIAGIPEFATLPDRASSGESTEESAFREELSGAKRVDYEAVMRLKEPALRRLFRAFTDAHRGTLSDRWQAFERFCAVQGRPLEDFATFCALDEHFPNSGSGAGWQRWPSAYRDPRSRSVEEFRSQFGEAVDYHRWIQFELDRQLGNVETRARAGGLALGLYGDLAIGSAGTGSDTWSFPRLFANAASLGAPPDDYSPTGQDWGLPPLHPHRLRAERYRYWTLLVRNAMQHHGALRIDHVMGLFRQFWIPEGRSGAEGAYVRFPDADLLGILALESRRAQALVVGEDLGTVPEGFSAQLARWGILSTRVLYFERGPTGRFRPAHRYSRRALVTATTHDHPPLAGFWTGRDLVLRREVNAIESDDALERERANREADKRALFARLRTDGILNGALDASNLIAAVHRFLAGTPAPLVGASLDDLTGETDPVNLPGVGLDRFPSWSRRMNRTLEEIVADPGVSRTLDALASRRQ